MSQTPHEKLIGRLVQLEMPEYKSEAYSFEAIYRTDVPMGPAAKWLIEWFVQQSGV